jgi:hypothetical protein
MIRPDNCSKAERIDSKFLSNKDQTERLKCIKTWIYYKYDKLKQCNKLRYGHLHPASQGLRSGRRQKGDLSRRNHVVAIISLAGHLCCKLWWEEYWSKVINWGGEATAISSTPCKSGLPIGPSASNWRSVPAKPREPLWRCCRRSAHPGHRLCEMKFESFPRQIRARIYWTYGRTARFRTIGTWKELK